MQAVPPVGVGQRLPGIGISEDSRYSPAKFIKEFQAKIALPFLIKIKRLLEVRLSFREDDRGHC